MPAAMGVLFLLILWVVMTETGVATDDSTVMTDKNTYLFHIENLPSTCPTLHLHIVVGFQIKSYGFTQPIIR